MPTRGESKIEYPIFLGAPAAPSDAGYGEAHDGSGPAQVVARRVGRHPIGEVRCGMEIKGSTERRIHGESDGGTPDAQ